MSSCHSHSKNIQFRIEKYMQLIALFRIKFGKASWREFFKDYPSNYGTALRGVFFEVIENLPGDWFSAFYEKSRDYQLIIYMKKGAKKGNSVPRKDTLL